MDNLSIEIREKQFASFCCRTAKNALVDFIRKEQRNVHAISFSELDDCDMAIDTSMETNVFSYRFYIKELNINAYISDTRLAAALKSLPEQLRTILLMSQILEIADKDIAKHLGISRQRVSTKRRQAMSKLTQILISGGQSNE